jgi:hypothetical protein
MQNAVFPGCTPVELKKDVPVKLSYTLILYNGKINEQRIMKEIGSIRRPVFPVLETGK